MCHKLYSSQWASEHFTLSLILRACIFRYSWKVTRAGKFYWLGWGCKIYKMYHILTITPIYDRTNEWNKYMLYKALKESIECKERTSYTCEQLV